MINFTNLLNGQPSVSEALIAVARKRKLHFRQSGKIPSPVVVFNITRRCNLNCQHCYLESQDKKYKGELKTREIKRTIDSFEKLEIPILLLSGGEPLVHKDIFKIIDYAKHKGIHVGLSTNGTLITKKTARMLKKTGIDYVGVSIDGLSGMHDRMRNLKGAYKLAMHGVINSLEAGLKTGIRFTITKANSKELPDVLDLCVAEKIPRFCMYHLVYSGRGKAMAAQDMDNGARRKIIDFLIKRTYELNERKYRPEILTVDNHADGIYIYNYLKQRNEEHAQQVLELIKFHGGCSSGNKIVDISPLGEVFPCQFWQEDVLGNILEKDFTEIWLDKKNKLLCQLRLKSEYLKGKCGRCRFKYYCGGCRIRANVVYNDFWQEDPCCYLTEEEIK